LPALTNNYSCSATCRHYHYPIKPLPRSWSSFLMSLHFWVLHQYSQLTTFTFLMWNLVRFQMYWAELIQAGVAKFAELFILVAWRVALVWHPRTRPLQAGSNTLCTDVCTTRPPSTWSIAAHQSQTLPADDICVLPVDITWQYHVTGCPSVRLSTCLSVYRVPRPIKNLTAETPMKPRQHDGSPSYE